MCVVLYVSWGLYFIPVADTPVAHRAFVYSFFFLVNFSARVAYVRFPPGPKSPCVSRLVGKEKKDLWSRHLSKIGSSMRRFKVCSKMVEFELY